MEPGIEQYWEAILAVITALVVLASRLARLIPNSTTNAFAVAMRKVARLVGLDVKDKE